MARSTTLVAVLAAGRGSRFTGPDHKLRSPLGDDTVLGRSLAAALAADIGPVVVVTGATTMALPPSVTELANPHWERGLATSVQVAVAHARAIGATSLVVGLGDQPLVSAAAWAAVADSPAAIAVATYGGQRGNPVKIDASLWDELPREGEEGARALMRSHPDRVEEVPCSGTAFDVDTVEDLEHTRRLLDERNDQWT
jgi:molybdenum cofactor cytidylyltransferase